MINLRNSPFLWFALLLLVAYGLISIHWSGIHLLPMSILVGLAVISAGAGLWKYTPGSQAWSTLAIGLMIFSAGTIRLKCFTTTLFPDPLILSSHSMDGVIEVTEVLKATGQKLSLKGRVHLLQSGDSVACTDRFILVQLRENNFEAIYPGHLLHIHGWVNAISGPLNPQAFDARTYYKSIGIRYQVSVKKEDAVLLKARSFSIQRFTAKWQSALCRIVTAHTAPDVAQLTNALVWGERTSMNQDIRDAFADAGAMHVLSVSGMHMAMIYSMLHLLLGAPGAGNFGRRMIRLVCYSSAILLYMGLTGACPAVVRSALMILLYLLGKAMGWNTPIWNLLGFAAFVMLWINPFVALNIGFQLSFLAMAGILFYAQPMIRYFSFKNIILHRAWEVTAVSLAAQVFIVPIILRQFYQFPLTFIASSFVAIPASYIVIFGSLINIVLSSMGFHHLWTWYDIACKYFIVSMKWMAGLNPDMNYSLPPIAALMLLGMAILFTAALVWYWPMLRKVALGLGLVVIGSLGCHRASQWQTSECIIYHQYSGVLVDIINDGQCISLQDSSVSTTSVEFAARGHRCYRDVIHTEVIYSDDAFSSSMCRYKDRLLILPDYRIWLYDGQWPQDGSEGRLTHILVTQGSEITEIKNFICNHQDAMVILPAHLKAQLRNALIRFCKYAGIKYWDINQDGFYHLPA